MKIKAWTLAELTVCVSILLVLSALCMNVVKPNYNKQRLFMYAVMKNLSSANSSLILSRGDTYIETLPDASATGCPNEQYCAGIADLFSYSGDVGISDMCGTQLDAGVCKAKAELVPMTLQNGVQIKGLANSWKDYSYNVNVNYKVKDILVDIDGFDNGFDKIWVDQYPLQIFSNRQKETLRIANCVTSDANLKSQYCPASASDYRNNDEIIKYDVYRATELFAGKKVKTELIASGISELRANCLANTWPEIYPINDCANNGYKVLPECDNTKIQCYGESVDICPDDNRNPENLPCFVILQKPSTGAGMLVDGVLQEVDI